MFGCNFSMLNYDTVAGGVFGSLRLGWNAGMIHASVYPSLFTYPTMNFGGFSPYQQYTTSNWLLDPGFALQSTFSNMQNYGCFGGGMVAPQSPWTTLGNLTITTKTPEEKAQEKEYKELKAVASEVIKKLDGDAKTKLQEAIDATEGTVQERIDSLKAELGKETAKDAAKALLLDPTDDIKVGTKKLSAILKDLGLDDELQTTDISDMNKYLSRTSGDITDDEVSKLDISKENVLLYMEGMKAEYIAKLEDKKNKNLYDEIIENLRTLAEDLINSGELDDKLQENLDKCRQRFSDENKDTAIIEDFKNLYACCLLGASQRADKQVKDGTSYDDIVGDSVYTDKAKEILKNKGLEDEVTNAMEGTVNVSDVPYDPTESDYYVPMTFKDNDELQKAHDEAAKVIAEIADANPSELDVKKYDSGQIRIKLADGRHVQFAFDDNGEITQIWVDYQEGGYPNAGGDITYYLFSDGSYYVSDWNSKDNKYKKGVKLENGNDFAKLQEACKDLVEVARKKNAEKSSEKEGGQQQ